jgi:hypothetical protein
LGHVYPPPPPPPPPGFWQPSMISSTNLTIICNAFLLAVSLVPSMLTLCAYMITHLKIRKAQLNKTVIVAKVSKTPGAVFPRPQDSDIALSSCAALPQMIVRAVDLLFQIWACLMCIGSLCVMCKFPCCFIHSSIRFWTVQYSLPLDTILSILIYATPSHHHATSISLDVVYRATHIH